MKDMIDICYREDIALDFISTHKYGANIGAFTGDFDPELVVIDRNVIVKDATDLKQIVGESSLPDIKIFFTEWGSSYLLPDPHHDDYRLASFVLDTIVRVEGKADLLSYWTVSDIFEEGGPPKDEFHGGFGLQTINGIKKPVWYAFEYLSRLGPVLVDRGENYIICKDCKENIQLLYWNFTFGDQISSKQMYSFDEPPETLSDECFQINDLKNGSYTMELYRTGYYSHNPIKMYREKGWSGSLENQMIELLKAESHGSPEFKSSIIIKDHIFNYTIPMHENDIVLITLTVD